MDIDKFIEVSILHQLGDLNGLQFSYQKEVIEKISLVSSGMALAWNSRKNIPYNFNDWVNRWNLQITSETINKTVAAVQVLLDSGIDYDFFMDMQDHRLRNILIDNRLTSPVFSFNRIKELKTARILCPHPISHDIGSNSFLGNLDSNRIPWKEKRDIITWRGGPGNWAQMGKYKRGKLTRMLPLLKNFMNNKIDQIEVERTLLRMDRYSILNKYIMDERFDIGFTSVKTLCIDDLPYLKQLLRKKIQLEDFQKYKYILVLPGSDVGSSFYWTLNSGSLALVMDCKFETFASCHFKPWKHYVPFRTDLSDFEERLEWCQSHQEECQQMVRNSALVCQYLAQIKTRKIIEKSLIQRLKKILPDEQITSF